MLAAFVLWGVMFSPLTAPHVPFWWMMAGSSLALSAAALLLRPALRNEIRFGWKDAVAGAAIAALLWGVFWTGDRLSSLVFDFARPQVNEIYAMKTGESRWLLSGLLLLIIGPAEEIFWRGYVQRTLSERGNPDRGFVAATALYALVHAASLNFMLVAAAFTAGAVWGALYRYFPHRFGAIVLSHALWDAAVFVWWPV